MSRTISNCCFCQWGLISVITIMIIIKSVIKTNIYWTLKDLIQWFSNCTKCPVSANRLKYFIREEEPTQASNWFPRASCFQRSCPSMFANHDYRTEVTNFLFYFIFKGPENKHFKLYWPYSSCCNYSILHCSKKAAVGNTLMSECAIDLQTI